MFLGHFLGDALGLPYEWKRSTALYSDRLDEPMKRIGMYGNVTELEVGQVSDDSEMTIILASHLFKNNFTLHKEDLVMSYLEWANHPTCFGMGKNTRQLFKGIKTFNGYLKRLSLNEKVSQSNGAMMRCSSLALVPKEEDMMRFAELDCSLTNPHPIPVLTNKVYLKILRGFLDNKQKETVLNEAYEVCKDNNEIKLVFEEALASKPRDIVNNKGWCLHALYCVVYCLINFTSYAAAISWVIRKGGDTDTNACIVGAVFGAYLGYDKLQKEEAENLRILLECTTTGGNKPRPNTYIPSYFMKKYYMFD